MDTPHARSAAPTTRPRQGAFPAAIGAALFAAAMSASPLASAQVNVKGDTGIDSSGNYRQERAWCMVNTEGEARVNCLKGSGAAEVEKRRGTLDNNGGNFSSNAMARCNIFMGEELAACKVRVLGYGGASGSVQGGGIIKQTETVVLPRGQDTVVVEPKTPNLIVVVPGDRR